jgi:plasmid maintenance system antidote protein VapI
MSIITGKFEEILEKKKLTKNKLALLINYDAGSLNKMIKGISVFPEDVIKKLLTILEVSKEEFESWVIADKYPKEILKRAVQVKKDFPYKRKSILTTKIDTILQEKDMSRTALSKEIKYSQSSINAMIVGKINMSKSVMERVSTALEIPQNEIQSWIIADKYSLGVLQNACLFNSSR